VCWALDDGEVRGMVEEVLFCCGWCLEVSIEGGGDVGLGGDESSFSEIGNW